ncbi:hypothetical protein EGH22_01615 [Halomicroarcula sp. F28]|uniref:Halobacterial output domain-containing protein n=2 Tax=Haloarcula salinisoli TaxID=2487746 RepID=A0A8J8C8T8_9EURY|nr:HalOD1 output domain-containing protein [Halomicroarcula salinisoli]MBX0285013.1 hypothetical protein [Halomicroarcula salinisoli]MBX0303509.1 hypothetical protein [Halomicroarcula salinisoli]
MTTDNDPAQCRCTPVYETEWTGSRQPPSMAIVEAVAAAEGVDPMELTPLSEEIDFEAFDRLLSNSAPDTCGVLSLRLSGWNVFVSGDGRIKVCEPSETAPLTAVFESVSADC